MRVLVTGGCGYIGSALIPRLQRAPEISKVVVLDSLAMGSPANLMNASLTRGFEFQQGDVRRYGDVENAVRGVDAVVHLAAITGAESTHDRREKTFDVNLEGTRNVVRAAEKFDVHNVIFASSCNNYGRAASKEIDETVSPQPINPYAEAKLESEELLSEFDGPDRTATSLRMSTNYGYTQGIRFNLVVNYFVFRALTERPLTVYGDGTNWRPFIHVEDSARAFAHAVRYPESWPASVYNVGSNAENYQIAEIAKLVQDVVDTEIEITYLKDEHPGPSYHVNFDRLTETGYTPERTLRDGIRELAEMFTNSPQKPRPLMNRVHD